MTRSWKPSAATDTWPWPPEVPRRPDQPPYPPYAPPDTPHEPSPASPPPAPILPTWEEPDPTWVERLILDRLLDQRVILATGNLDAEKAGRVSAQLLLLDRTDHTRPIDLHLSFRDSELEPSLALAAGMDLIRARVRAVVTGPMSGPAVAVVCAAPERHAHRHATFVLRLPHVSAQGSAPEVAAQVEGHEHAVAVLVERIATVSGRDTTAIDHDLRAGIVLTAEEAKGYGLVSRVLGAVEP
ncbi:MAG: ATP-dependent Clp protease proteolytic subunit [Nocardioides sp.]|nr:ATP-dependent Clp protease proteolytic subunit [Nocardioides sp.]